MDRRDDAIALAQDKLNTKIKVKNCPMLMLHMGHCYDDYGGVAIS